MVYIKQEYPSTENVLKLTPQSQYGISEAVSEKYAVGF